jgi:hypothetical protein
VIIQSSIIDVVVAREPLTSHILGGFEFTSLGDVIGLNGTTYRKAQPGDALVGVVSDTAGFVGPAF